MALSLFSDCRRAGCGIHSFRQQTDLLQLGGLRPRWTRERLILSQQKLCDTDAEKYGRAASAKTVAVASHSAIRPRRLAAGMVHDEPGAHSPLLGR
jgi:hypothetical protein